MVGSKTKKNRPESELFFIFRLYDDGGLTLLLPYILTTRAKFANCQLRVFFLSNKTNTLDEEARSMAALLVISKLFPSNLDRQYIDRVPYFH